MSNAPLLILLWMAYAELGERADGIVAIPTLFPLVWCYWLIACAMGLKRGDMAIRELAEEVTIGIRADRAGALMTDFQTITGDLITAEGKRRAKHGETTTILSRRQYLFDAAFLVVISGPEDTLERISAALLQPKWQIFWVGKAAYQRDLYLNP